MVPVCFPLTAGLGSRVLPHFPPTLVCFLLLPPTMRICILYNQAPARLM